MYNLTALWADYETAPLPATRAVKPMDRQETLLQHNQGANAPDFDDELNQDYGREQAGGCPCSGTSASRPNLHAGLA
ncbi:MAG: hypothetical protein ACWGIK_03975 [Achromobacter pulmonis]|uniref:Uncharacterized protein n=1 Tax=Achromobacter pulmonis TaxID=1389932 RepID=A0A6S7CLY1_9BURK|nr:hypothetical protein [Achromobacter pulmonis]MCF7769751.1 HD domain-containing protein [Achromobacter pulmonis]CAB3628745.1 hypothetical protein LMG26696_00523 [Achromobacter pulmonis]CAB3853672.1 hypothetical protein LMG26788_01895 [Achromobacter pulmonis]